MLLPQTGDLAFLGPPGVRRRGPGGRGHQRRRWRARQRRRRGQGRLGRRHSGHRRCRGRQAAQRRRRHRRRCRIVGRVDHRHRQDHGCRRRCSSRRRTPRRASTATRSTRKAFTSVPLRPTTCRARSWPTSSSRTASRTSPSWVARTSTVEGLAERTRDVLEEKGATVSDFVLYAADAQNFTAEVNQVAASKPDAIVMVSFDEITTMIPQLIAKGLGPQDVQIYFVDGNLADYSDEDFDLDRCHRHRSELRGAGRGVRGAALERTRRSDDLHVRTGELRRRPSSRRSRRSRPATTPVRRSAPRSSTSPVRARSAPRSRSAPHCSRTARTSTTRARAVRRT